MASIRALRIPMWAVWLSAVSVPIGWATTAWLYFDALGRSGTLDPYHDTVFIPMMGNVFFALVISPFVFGITYLAGKTYNGIVDPFAWRSDRPALSLGTAACFLGPAVYLSVRIGLDWRLDLPAYERILDAETFLIVIWLLLMRSIAMGQARDGTL